MNRPSDVNNNKYYSTWNKTTQYTMNNNYPESTSSSSNANGNNEENLSAMNYKNASSVEELNKTDDIAKQESYRHEKLEKRQSTTAYHLKRNDAEQKANLPHEKEEKIASYESDVIQSNEVEEKTSAYSNESNGRKSPTTIDRITTNGSPIASNSPENQSLRDARPQATSSPTFDQNTDNDTETNEDDSTISKDTSIHLSELSSPEKSTSFESQRSTGRSSTSSTSPAGRSLYNSWPYVSVYNPYRSSSSYSSSAYSMKSSTPYTRSSFTKKYF